MGFCKFGEKCRFLHIDELCDINNCDQRNCSLQHPRDCFYYKKYKNCKFGDWCRYSHNITDITEEQFKTISVEIETLKSEISALKEENKLLYKRLHVIEEHCDKRKNILENEDDYENDSERE